MLHHPLSRILLVILALSVALPTVPPTVSHAQDGTPTTISRLVWSADGSHLAALMLGYLFIYDLNTPDQDPVIISHEPLSYLALVFSPDNTLFALNATVYEVATGKQVYTLTLPADRQHAATAFSPDGQWVVYGDMWGWLHVADATTGEVIHQDLNSRAHADDGGVQVPVFDIVGLLFAPDGSWLASADWGSQITFWDTTAWEVTGNVAPYSLKAQRELQVSPDGTLLVTQDSFGYAHVWDVAALTETVSEEHQWQVASGVGFVGNTPIFVYQDETSRMPRFFNPLAETYLEVDFSDVILDPDHFQTWVWLSESSITLYDYESTRAYRYDLTGGFMTDIGPVGRPIAVSDDGMQMAVLHVQSGAPVIWDWHVFTHITLRLPLLGAG